MSPDVKCDANISGMEAVCQGLGKCVTYIRLKADFYVFGHFFYICWPFVSSCFKRCLLLTVKLRKRWNVLS